MFPIIAIFGGNVPTAILLTISGIGLALWLAWSIRTYNRPQTPPRLPNDREPDYGVSVPSTTCDKSFTDLMRLTDQFHGQNPDLLSYDPPTWDWPERG